MKMNVNFAGKSATADVEATAPCMGNAYISFNLSPCILLSAGHVTAAGRAGHMGRFFRPSDVGMVGHFLVFF